MASGTVNSILRIKVIKNAFTFEQTTSQTVQLNDYAGWALVDVYTNNDHVSLRSNTLVTDLNWDFGNGILTITKPAGAWVEVTGTVVLIRP